MAKLALEPRSLCNSGSSVFSDTQQQPPAPCWAHPPVHPSRQPHKSTHQNIKCQIDTQHTITGTANPESQIENSQLQQNWLWNIFAKSGILLIRHNHDFNSLIWCSLTKQTIPWRVFSALGANTGEWVMVILADKISAFSSYSFHFHQLLSEANRGRLYSSIWKTKASVLTTLRLIWEDRRLRSLWIPPKGAALSSQKTPCPAQSQILLWTLQERFTRCIQALC